MATLPASDSSIDLRGVTVRPTWGAQEHRRWDRLVAEHHYLRFHGVVGKGLRHVAVHGESWLALLGWQPGAFKLAARDRWVGWSAQQQFKRLHLIANNSRFVILTPERVPALAARMRERKPRRHAVTRPVRTEYRARNLAVEREIALAPVEARDRTPAPYRIRHREVVFRPRHRNGCRLGERRTVRRADRSMLGAVLPGRQRQ